MNKKLIHKIPGKPDIIDQFKDQNLSKTLRLLKKLLKDGDGDYLFGALTAAYYGYAPNSPDYIRWMQELRNYDTAAQDKIKKAVIAAVNHQPKPLPINFTWDPNGSPKDVIVSQNSSPPSYTIAIVGYPEPLKSAFADRKKT
jgi:hypothetical protein